MRQDRGIAAEIVTRFRVIEAESMENDVSIHLSNKEAILVSVTFESHL